MNFVWLVSDIHLTPQVGPRGVIFLNFLKSLGVTRMATHLVLLGDIFDLWLGDFEEYQTIYFEYVQEIINVKSRGIEIVYLEGNHDLNIANFWKKRGVKVYPFFTVLFLDHQKILLEHGDFINKKEVTYHRALRFVKGPWGYKIIHLFGARFWMSLGARLSQYSRNQNDHAKSSNTKSGLSADIKSDKLKTHSVDLISQNLMTLKKMIRDYANSRSAEIDFDMIVTGHVHVQDDYSYTYNHRPQRSINLGSWLDEPKALLISSQTIVWEFLK